MAITIQTLFEEYYSNYRGDDETPTTTDPEWKVFLRLANNAINRWENVDGVLWRELWGDDNSQTIQAATYQYNCPADFKFIGGYVQLTSNVDTNYFVNLQIIDVMDVPVMSNSFAYVSGNPQDGYKINLSDDAIVDRTGWNISYRYYKSADRIIPATEAGTFVPEMADPYFIVHNALANRFRASRNTVGYQTANKDAETALQGMQHRNDMGSPHNPWNLLSTDTTGGWGT